MFGIYFPRKPALPSAVGTGNDDDDVEDGPIARPGTDSSVVLAITSSELSSFEASSVLGISYSTKRYMDPLILATI